MKIGLYDPYLDTLGGGEKYMLTAAECLAVKHEISFFWDDATILEKVRSRFAIDTSHITTVPNVFTRKTSFFERIRQTKKFDTIIYLSDGSIPFVGSKKLFLHFQFPVEHINGKTLLAKYKLQRVTGIICNSFFTKAYIDKTFDVVSTVLYPPASGEILSKSEKKENIILSVGRFNLLPDGTTFKKQEVLIEIFKKMIDKGLKDWKFILVVSYHEKDKAQRSFFAESIKNYPIEIYENLPSDKLKDIYEKTKIYWHAAGFDEDLKKHPERAEHFGIVTVQAMEKGAVPVVFDAGGQTEIVEKKCGFLWETKEELEEKTSALINDESMWKKFSIQAKEDAKKFSKSVFCKKLYSVIE
ncbi:MAG: glycosyltransferase [Candidatus Levyibacteriota bacterium]